MDERAWTLMNTRGKLVGMRNNWRQRVVTVHEHPADPDLVVTVGMPFDGGELIVCVETRAEWAATIAAFPRVVTRD